MPEKDPAEDQAAQAAEPGKSATASGGFASPAGDTSAATRPPAPRTALTGTTATTARPPAPAPAARPPAAPGQPAWASGSSWPAPQPVWSPEVWPLTRDGAPPRVLLAAVAAGGIGAATLVTDRLGLGIVLAATAVLGAALATRPHTLRHRQVAFAALTLALTSVAAIRSAGWLVGLCLLGAVLTGILSVTAGRTWTGLGLGALSPLTAPLRTFTWTVRGTSRLKRRRFPVVRALLVAAVSLTLLTIFGALFAGADPVFAELVGNLLPRPEPGPGVGRVVLFAFAAGVALLAATLAHQAPDFDALAPTTRPTRPRLEWAIPLTALNLLFAGFVGVQLVVLADGDRYVRRTAGLTYADYARQGFWQLLAVTALTLLVIAVVVRIAGRATRGDRIALRTLLGLLCLLSALVVASALRRMWLYEDAYGFTRLRVLVQAVELGLGVVFGLIAVAGLRLEARWLPRAVLATGALTLLGLAALNPDGFIADHNVTRYERTGRIDVGYLSGLSADAIPALDRLPEPRRACALGPLLYDLPDHEPWYSANLSRSRARDLPVGPC
ncbi:DUF4153 domain-containing protein [Cryptosporangium sp. NPDC051539]|uniref:DUF4153 domain-containing protein n=1 Tax=Cryptosporangium sp. NPDC051539 TaxID=3363962 RepID=UPI0037A0E86A